jgi:ferric-dicitrate binding protein FerR (iron transport regulator)
MSRARKDEAGARLGALLEQGDHGRAAAEARRLAADPGTPAPGRQEALAVLASLRPEGGAQVVGAVGLALALAITGWLLTR